MTSTVRGGPRRASRGFPNLFRMEWRLELREPWGIIWGMGLPVFLLVVFGNIPHFRTKVAGTGLTLLEVYLPTLVATVLVMVSLVSLPIPLVRDREIGWLRRISTTPVSPVQLLAARLVMNLQIALVAIATLLVGVVLISGLPSNTQFGGFVLAAALTTAAMISLGLLIASVARTQKEANGFLLGLLYPNLFLAGVYVPLSFLPAWVQSIADYTPVGAGVRGMTDALQGTFPGGLVLGASAAYAVLFGALAVRWFRWE